ncbi:hypothetical protein INR49_022207 [Caranx melampygus]|nr:hypothetical protein INR49_022207 [Caranx melampygus]
MEPSRDGTVRYDRWNEDDINMNVETSQSTVMRACGGNTGIAMRTAGALAALVSIYIIGYVTGYYIHRC